MGFNFGAVHFLRVPAKDATRNKGHRYKELIVAPGPITWNKDATSNNGLRQQDTITVKKDTPAAT